MEVIPHTGRCSASSGRAGGRELEGREEEEGRRRRRRREEGGGGWRRRMEEREEGGGEEEDGGWRRRMEEREVFDRRGRTAMPHLGFGLVLVLPAQEAGLHVVGVEHKGRGRRAGDLAVELEPVVREELVEVGEVGDNAVKISAFGQGTVGVRPRRLLVCVAAARDNPGIRTLGGQ